VYFGLDRIGAWIWTLIQSPITIDQICAALVQKYDVDRARCERDVQALVADMAREGLVRIVSSSDSQSP
jgi:uncharacterized NAD(P)/FAD-binding protein YdhS